LSKPKRIKREMILFFINAKGPHRELMPLGSTRSASSVALIGLGDWGERRKKDRKNSYIQRQFFELGTEAHILVS